MTPAPSSDPASPPEGSPMISGRPALSGTTTVRVRYCECDPMGVAHHSAYAPWLEMGRTELLRTTGISYARLEAGGTFLVVVSLELTFRRPALYDDILEIRTGVRPGGRVKIEHTYEVVLGHRDLGHRDLGHRDLGHRDRGSHPGRAAGLAASASQGDILAIGRTVLACVGEDGAVRALPDWLTARGQAAPGTTSPDARHGSH